MAEPPPASCWRPRVARLLLHRLWLRAGASPAVPRTHAASRAAQAAATATPPWSDRCSTPGPPFAHAPASREPLHSIPHALSPIPHSDAPEHRRRSAERRRAHPRRRTHSSALPRPKLTPPVAPTWSRAAHPPFFPRQSFTGASPPLTPTAADRLVTRSRRHRPPRAAQKPPRGAPGPLFLSHPDPLAAGARRRR